MFSPDGREAATEGILRKAATDEQQRMDFSACRASAHMGEDAAPWYVGWYDGDGHRHKESCGPGFRGKQNAEKRRRQIENELMTGTYRKDTRKPWPDFRREYEERILPGLAPETRRTIRVALSHFERLVKPVRVFGILTQHIDDFIAARRKEPGKKKGDLVSPASVNKDLRHIKAALAVAFEWGYLHTVPKVPHGA